VLRKSEGKAMKFPMNKKFNTLLGLRLVLLLLIAFVLNIALGHFVQFVLKTPLFLDSIGTILVGAFLGPLAGATVGAFTNIIWYFILGDQSILPYAITAAFIGWAAGIAFSLDGFNRFRRIVVSGLLVGIGAAIISAPITAYIFSGVTGAGTDYLASLLRETGANILQAATIQGIISDPVDKMISFTLSWLLWREVHRYFPFSKKRTAQPFATLQGYSLAVFSSIVSLMFSFLFLPAFSTSIFSVFYLTVLVSALRGGIGPSLFTTAVGVLANIIFLFSPFHTIKISAEDFFRLGVFIIISVAIAIIVNQLEKNKKDLERALQLEQETEARIRAITDSVNEGLLLISKDQRVLDLNQQFVEMFGVPPKNILNQYLCDIQTMFNQIFSDSDELFDLFLNSSADNIEEYSKLVEQNWPQKRELFLYSTPISDAAGYLGRLFVFLDVTHEREVDRMKTEFVSLVSHELRTPLTSIKGYTELVLDGDAGEIDEEVEEYLGIVYKNAERLVALVNDLLDISRIESGRVQLNIEPVDLNEIVQTVTATMQHSIQDKQQILEAEFDSAATSVMGDKSKLIQVLTNYVSNAYKYTQIGGHIRILIERQGDFAYVSVSDDGYGISPKDQGQLFTRFYRVDNSMTREVGGTGLGLSIVKQLIDVMGGDVGVQSELGEGSNFWLTVPLASDTEPNHQEDDQAKSQDSAELTQANILIVEDDLDTANLIKHHLIKAGYKVRTALSAEDALKEISNEIPDLITLDVILPGMQGDQLANKLHNDPLTQNIPILILSVYADDLTRKQFGTYLLPKPIHQEELIKTVNHMLNEPHHGRLLIIDDDSDIGSLLRSELVKRGYEVCLVPDPENGLAHAEENEPSLILLNLNMSSNDDLKFLKKIKENPKTQNTPVIAMMGSSELKTDAQARFLTLGASDFIVKPFDMEKLVKEITVFIDNKEVENEH
jgi:signal transduction histidine kinase/DNA-binding response OmpR family regulator